MRNIKINTKELSLFYDGEDFYFGSFNSNNFQFVSLGNQCATLEKEIINHDFKEDTPNLMVLSDAIEGNVYGEDRNLGLENGGLDMRENKFINAIYVVGEIDKQSLLKYQYIINKKIKTRWANCTMETTLRDVEEELSQRINIEREE